VRRTCVNNIERTNRLFDPVVTCEHGSFEYLIYVADLLRAGKPAGPAGDTVAIVARQHGTELLMALTANFD
jgi:hypothetical protein